MDFEVFDIETINHKDGTMVPYALSYTKKNKYIYHVFTEGGRDEMCRHILSNFTTSKVYYAHNLIFDFLLLLPGFLNVGSSYTWVYVNNELYAATINFKGKKIRFRCSYKIIPIKLADFFPFLASVPKLYFPYSSLNK
jgi:hypothetical protein